VGKRIFSSALLWSVVVATLWFFRATGIVVMAGVVAVLTIRELFILLRACGYMPFDKLGMVLAALITIAPWLEAKLHCPMEHLLAVATVIVSIRLLGERTPQNRMESLCATMFGLVYVPVMISYYARIVTPLPGDAISPNGRLLLCLWLIAVTKFCDMGGLLTGLAIGRHKMSPLISPKKTWEGAIGGVIASMAIGAALAWWGRDLLPAHMTPLVAALMAAPIAVVGIVGDLVESVIKRRADIKDSAKIIPAMGGFFDMSDSLILTAPIGYLLFGLP
jgi:phosphatidate cytidylyltransferase